LKKQHGVIQSIDVAKTYFSQVEGARDYIDYCIHRYCVLSPDGKRIIKDKRKALGYLKDIDLFALAMTVHFFLELDSSITRSPASVKKMLGLCVTGEYIQVEKPPPSNRDNPNSIEQTQPPQSSQPTSSIQIVMIPGTSPKKARIIEVGSSSGPERVVRCDAQGEYVMWKGGKVYLNDTV
jgi:type II secretory pathway pseudopilin PulG